MSITINDRYPGIQKRILFYVVVFVGGKEEQFILNDRPAKRNARIIVRERRTSNISPVVIPGVCVQIIVSKKVKDSAAKLISARASPKVNASTRRTARRGKSTAAGPD